MANTLLEIFYCSTNLFGTLILRLIFLDGPILRLTTVLCMNTCIYTVVIAVEEKSIIFIRTDDMMHDIRYAVIKLF